MWILIVIMLTQNWVSANSGSSPTNVCVCERERKPRRLILRRSLIPDNFFWPPATITKITRNFFLKSSLNNCYKNRYVKFEIFSLNSDNIFIKKRRNFPVRFFIFDGDNLLQEIKNEVHLDSISLFFSREKFSRKSF